jgi:hypothetical protein
MIVCVCRNISDQQYANREELVKRLLEKDLQCSACMNYINELKKNVECSQKKGLAREKK